MKTEFYESDPFSPRRAALLLSVDTDYRFERGDELVIDGGGHSTKVRIMSVSIRVNGGVLSREILALKV